MRVHTEITGTSKPWGFFLIAFIDLVVFSRVAIAQETDPSTPAATSASSESEGSTAPESMVGHSEHSRYLASGQINFIFQTHPDFPAAYSGVNSSNPYYEKATSRAMTLYTGLQLNNSTEVLVDIEAAGGAGLSTGLGVAGFPNMDVVRNPCLSQAPYLARGMIHKVFALSKDKVESERTVLSLFEELPRRRLEIRFGKLSTVDFFDVNGFMFPSHR
jgi:high affinity Mn2+ porin